MGIKEWFEEKTKQMYEEERREARKKYKNKPRKLDEALRRIDAREKPSNKSILTPDPVDITGLDEYELQTLLDQTEIEIEDMQNRLASSKQLIAERKPKNPGGIMDQLGQGLFLFSETAAQEQIKEKKKLIAAIKVKLNKPAPIRPKPPTLDPDEEILEKMKQVKKREAELLAKESDPDIRKEIQLAARKKLDKLREKL